MNWYEKQIIMLKNYKYESFKQWIHFWKKKTQKIITVCKSKNDVVIITANFDPNIFTLFGEKCQIPCIN